MWLSVRSQPGMAAIFAVSCLWSPESLWDSPFAMEHVKLHPNI